MSRKRILILIPARFDSTRFPGKPLALIDGISMIQRVFQNCSQAKSQDLEFISYVVTDDQRVEEHVKTFSSHVIRVDDEVISGTLRIQLAYERFFSNANPKFDLIINVQGDEPLLLASDLVGLAHFHLSRQFDIATLVKKHFGFSGDFMDSNKVKVAMSEETGKAFYFSRAPIPFKREKSDDVKNDYWFLHIGVYSYLPSALNQFIKMSETRLEYLEKLEQLRALECGLSIGAFETEGLVVGVDHPNDIKKVEEVLNGRK